MISLKILMGVAMVCSFRLLQKYPRHCSMTFHTTTLQSIQSDLARGRRIRLVQDYYGQQYAEIQPRWGFWGKKRVRLDHDEAVALKELIAKPKPERR